MIKYYKELEQGTPEWFDARCGILTASVMHTLITPTLKIADNQGVRTLAFTLAAQRITGRIMPQAYSKDTERGHAEEPLALSAYETKHGKVESCGFITNDKLGFKIGYSPDGIQNQVDGKWTKGVEVKSRIEKFQLETFLADKVPSEYMVQCQMGFFIAEMDSFDFIQFSNGMPLFIKSVEPNYDIIDVIEVAAKSFENRVLDIIGQWEEKTQGCIETVWVDHEEENEPTFEIEE